MLKNIFYLIEFLTRINDCYIANFSSFALIKILWKTAHENKLWDQYSLEITISLSYFSIHLGFNKRLFLGLKLNIIGKAVVLDEVYIFSTVIELESLQAYIEYQAFNDIACMFAIVSHHCLSNELLLDQSSFFFLRKSFVIGINTIYNI